MDVEQPPQPLIRRLVNSLSAWSPALIEHRVRNAAARRVPGLLAQYRVPGLQLALRLSGRETVHLAFGVQDVSTGTALEASTRFRVASLTKPIAAIVLRQAAAAGVLRLDEPLLCLADLPSLARVPERQLRRLTLRRLIDHRAGFATAHPPHREFGVLYRLEECLAEVVTPPLEDDLVRYSGVNYMLAEWAAERQSGFGFESLAQDHVLGPMGLEGVRFSTGTCVIGAAYHDADGRPLQPVWTPALASSGLVASAGEYAALLAEALRAARGLRSCLDAGVAAAWLEHADKDGGTFGCGMYRRLTSGHLGLEHGGVRPGFRGFAQVIPDRGLVMVCLTNGENGDDITRPLMGLARDLARRSSPVDFV